LKPFISFPGGTLSLTADSKCWTTPALSDGRLYVRSTKEAACLDLSGH